MSTPMNAVTQSNAEIWLSNLFGTEFEDLSVPQRMVLGDDYAGLSNMGRREYARNIGRGNLSSYANTLLVQMLMGAGYR